MKRLEDPTLLAILQNQEKMEDYLVEFRDKPSSIDPIIWQVHFSAPAKKRMPILDRYLKELVRKYSLVFSFLPDHLVLAKVYKVLNIPFNINSSKTSTVDLVSCKKPKIARSNRYVRMYTSWCKAEKNSELGIYEYSEESPGPFIPYTEFRKECKNKKVYNISAADVLSQLSKSKTKEKLLSNFASSRTQFSLKNCGQPTNSRTSARDADQFAGKQTNTNFKIPECNLLKKQTLPKESNFHIFKSKCRPRLDVQVTTKRSDAASLPRPTTNKPVSSGSFLKASDSRELCSLSTLSIHTDKNIETSSISSGSLRKIPNSPTLRGLSTSSKNEDETVLANRIDIDDRSQSKELPSEANVTVEETAVERNLNNSESIAINLYKASEEDANQLCSEESISVIQPTPIHENICTPTLLEPEVIYSSNRSEDDVASIECSTHRLLDVTPRPAPFDEERNSAEMFGQPNEANFTLSPACVKPSQSHSSCEHLSSDQSKETLDIAVIDDFDQLYKRTPLKIVRKKNLMSLKKAKHSDSGSAFDRLYEELENNRPDFEMVQIGAEKEKNKVSDSEVSIVSSKASPSLVHSVIYAQRSSESESEEIDETSFSAVPSSSDAPRGEPIDHIPGQPASDIVYITKLKARSQSRNSTPQKSAVSKIVSTSRGKPSSQSESSTPERCVPEIVSTSPEKLHSKLINSTPERPVVKIIRSRKTTPRSQTSNSTPEQPASKTMSVSKEMPCSQSQRSTPEQPASKIVSVSQEDSRSLSKNSTSKHVVSNIMSASNRSPGSQSKRSTPEQPVPKIVPVSRENPRPQSKNSTSQQSLSKIVSATVENARSQSKNSIPEQPELEIVAAGQEKSRSVTKKPTKKKMTSLNSSKAGKKSKAKTDKKRVKKLTDLVAFSVRKRQASSFEFGESDDQTVGLCKKKSPTLRESAPRSTSTWSSISRTAGSRKIRKVKKLFSESEDHFSPSPVRDEPPAKVGSSDYKMCGPPSSSKRNDRSEVQKSSDSDSSPKLHSASCYQSRGVKKLFIESEDSLMSPVKEKPSEVDFDREMCEPLSLSKHTDLSEIEIDSNSDSSSSVLSKEFKTLSLASRKSHILFSSESSKMSPSSTRSVNIRNSQASTVLNSQFSAEITLDQVDQMMEGVIPNEAADSSFRFDLPSQFAFKESPNSENYGDKFNESNFSDILISSSSALEKTLITKESPDEYSISSSDEEAVNRPYLSNFASQDTTYPASRSTFNDKFSSSLCSLEMAPNEDTKDEFSNGKISDSFSIRKSSITLKKSKRFLSPKFNDGLLTRRHCLSLPTGNKSSQQKKELKKRHKNVADIDSTSDEDVFRDSSCRSLPTQLKKKPTSLSNQQLIRRKYRQNKENQIDEKKSQQKFKNVRDFQKLPLTVAAKSSQFSKHEKKKSPISSQKSSQFAVTSDDDYESDELNIELNTALNDSLTQFNKWKKNKDVSESDAESTTSQYFDADIAQLLTEYEAMNAEQQPLTVSSRLSNSESTSFMSTWSVQSNSPNLNPKNRASSKKPVTSGASNYKDLMWNSFPDSLETALTTPEEKLEQVRSNLREKVNNSNSQKLFSSSQKSKSSRENESDSFGFLDWE